MPEHNKNNILPAYSVRLRDLLRPVARVEVRCEACGHRRELDPLTLACRPLVGPDAFVRGLERQLRCDRASGGCGMKGWVKVTLSWL